MKRTLSLMIALILACGPAVPQSVDWLDLSPSLRGAFRERLLSCPESFWGYAEPFSPGALPLSELSILLDMSLKSRLSSVDTGISSFLADIRTQEERFFPLFSECGGSGGDLEIERFSSALESSASALLESWDAKASAVLEEVRGDCIALGLPPASLSLSEVREGIERECGILIARSKRGLLSLGAERGGFGSSAALSSPSPESFEFLFEEPEGVVPDPAGYALSEGFEEGLSAWNDAYLDFLSARSAWEERTGEALSEGEKGWERVIQGLAESRDTWSADFEQTLCAGREGFVREAEALSSAYCGAQERLSSLLEFSETEFLENLSAIRLSYREGKRILEEAREMAALGVDEVYWLGVMGRGDAMRKQALALLDSLEGEVLSAGNASGAEEELGRLRFIMDRTEGSAFYRETFASSSSLYEALSRLSPVLGEDAAYRELKAAEASAIEVHSAAEALMEGFERLCAEEKLKAGALHASLDEAFSSLFISDYSPHPEGLSWEDLSPSEELLADEAALARQSSLWAEELAREGDGLSGLLRELGCASFYAEDRSELAGLLQNQYMVVLADKLGADPTAYALRGCEKSFLSIHADPRKKRLFEFYQFLLSSSKFRDAELHDSMTRQDLIASMAEYLKGEAGPVVARHRTNSAALGTTAAAQGVLAAAALCSLNFVAAAVFGALSSASLAASLDERSKAEDLEQLCSQLPRVSGNDERALLIERVGCLRDAKAEYGSALDSLARLTGEFTDTPLLASDVADLALRLGLDTGVAEGLFPLIPEESKVSFASALSAMAALAFDERSLRSSDCERWMHESLLSYSSWAEELHTRLLETESFDISPIVSGFSSPGIHSQGDLLLSEFLWARNGRRDAATGGLEAEYLELEIGNLAFLRSHLVSSGLRENAYKAEWEFKEIADREGLWEGEMAAAKTEGGRKWSEGIAAARAKRENCRKEFFSEYGRRAESIAAGLDEFLEAMNEWILENAEQGARLGLESASVRFGLNPRYIAELNSLSLFSDIGFDSSASRFLSGMKDEMDCYLSEVRSRVCAPFPNEGVSAFRFESASGKFPLTALSLDIPRLGDEIERDIALLSASYLRRGFSDAREAVDESIERANAQVERSFDTMLTERGYARSGSVYSRKALVDLSLLRYENESQRIDAYAFFKAPGLRESLTLDDSLFRAGSGSEVYEAIGNAFSALEDYQKLIFGTADVGQGPGKGDLGLFGLHVGAPPEVFEGSLAGGTGEYGRICTALHVQELELSRGLSMLDIPSYRRRLWDDDEDNDGVSDSLFKAPDLASVYDLALGVAVNAFLPPGFGSIALNLVDNALFGGADASAGCATGDEILFSLGKEALSGALSYGTSSLFGAAQSRISFEGLGAVAVKTALRGAQTGIDLLAKTALSSCMYSSGEGFSFDEGAFSKALISKGSLARLASNLGHEAVCGSLGLATLRDTAGFSLGTLGELRGLNQMAGAAAGAGIDYALSGDVVLSLLGVEGSGIVELSLGEDGGSLGLGSGGWDFRPGTLETAGLGLLAAATNGRIQRFGRDFSALNEADPAFILRAQYSYGDEAARNSLRGLLSGNDVLAFSSSEAAGYTELSESGGRIMHIASWDGSEESLVRSALILQHEAHRDGVAGGDNCRETLQAVAAHTMMAMRILSDGRYGGDSLPNEFISEDLVSLFSGRLSDYVARNYDSSGDYWKLKKNGNIVWDGKFDLFDEEGNRVLDGVRGSYSSSLGLFIGEGKTAKDGNAEVVSLLAESGILWSRSGGYHLDQGLKKQFPGLNLSSIEFAASDSVILAAMKPEDAYRVLVERGRLKSEAYEFLSGYGTSPESLGFDRFVSPEDFVASAYPFAALGNITRTQIPKYDQITLAKAVLGETYSKYSGNQYCNIDVLALAIMKKTGKSFGEVAKAVASVDSRYFDKKEGCIKNYEKTGEAVLSQLGVKDYGLELLLYHGGKDDVLSALRTKGSDDLFIGGYYKLGDSGHWVHIDQYGTLSNPYPHETIWSEDWELSYMNLFKWVKK